MTRRSDNLLFILPALALILLLTSCSLAAQEASLTEQGINRDEAIILRGGQPRTLDPALTRGGPSDALGHIFSGLTTLNADLQVEPELAAGWDVSDDGLTYTFFLRQNAQFHNGRSVTASDIIFSWERAAAPGTGSDTVLTYLGDIVGVAERHSGAADSIRGLRQIDDQTLEVQLLEPVPYFLAKLAYPVAYVVDEDNVAQTDWEKRPNGTGPFTLQTWRDDEIIILARHAAYYLPPAEVAHVVYLLSPGLALSQYETDEIDLVGIGGSNLERVRDPNNPLTADLSLTASMCTSTIGLNNQRPPLDDARVRQALSYALDREKLIDTFSNGNAIEAVGVLPPNMPGYAVGRTGYPFDPERARALLAEAGYADPATLPPLTFSSAGFSDVGAYETAVITMWQENLGIRIEPQLIEPFAYLDELYAGNIGHLYTSGWCADYPDPQNFLDILYHSAARQNLGGYQNERVDQLLEAARREPSVATRLALYQEAETLIVADAASIFVSHGISAVLIKPRLENYQHTPLGVRQWHRVTIKKP